MVGFCPDEGDVLRGQLLLQQVAPDRGTNLQLLLVTNGVPLGDALTEAAVTEPVGNGYARITLTDGTWTDNGDGTFSYTQQAFTPAGGDWVGVTGYAIATLGTTPRLIFVEEDVNAPITIPDGIPYNITPLLDFT